MYYFTETNTMLLTGLPDYDFPPLDPLFYANHHAKYDNDQMHIDVEAINITILGMMDLRILDVKTHFSHDVLRLEVHSHLPKCYVEGQIKATGNIGPFRMNNTGRYKKILCLNCGIFISQMHFYL